MRAGNSSSTSRGGSGWALGRGATVTGLSRWPLANPLALTFAFTAVLTVAVVIATSGLEAWLSGTFSFCTLETVSMRTGTWFPNDDGGGVACFFFLAVLDVGLGAGIGVGLDVTGEGLEVSGRGLSVSGGGLAVGGRGLAVNGRGLEADLEGPLTMRREEISNMVGTARCSCIVLATQLSSSDGGEGRRMGCFFLREEEEEERSWGPAGRGRGGLLGGGLEEEEGRMTVLEVLLLLAWLQAEVAPPAGLGGRILETRAGKSSSWKEECFLGWAE